MKCIHCGNELAPGMIYCTQCGREAQIVPDYNELDDLILDSVLEEENLKRQRQEQQARQLAAEREAKKKQDALAAKKAQQKKIIIISVVVAIVAVILIAIAIIAAVRSSRNGDADYQIKQAQEAMKDGNVDKAISYYEKALTLDEDNIDVRFVLADIYLERGEKEAAIIALKEIIEIDPGNADAYGALVDIYASDNQYDQIKELADGVTDKKILKQFEGFLVEAPEFSDPEGAYDAALKIILSTSGKTNIYYSFGDDDPVKEGKLFTSAIDINQAGETVLNAVAVNENGVYSDVVSATYKIDFAAPDMPVVTPDGGTFSTPTSVSVTVPEDCTAYYTWDSSDPHSGSEMYTGPIEVIEGNNILSVILINNKTDKYSSIYRGRFEYYAE